MPRPWPGVGAAAVYISSVWALYGFDAWIYLFFFGLFSFTIEKHDSHA